MMNCPRCETSQLLERERDGVIIDICLGCRGVWLDKGELDKLIAKAVTELNEVAPSLTPSRSEVYTEASDRKRHYGAPDSDRDPRLQQRHYGAPDSDRDPRHYSQRRHGKRSWFESLGDLFD